MRGPAVSARQVGARGMVGVTRRGLLGRAVDRLGGRYFEQVLAAAGVFLARLERAAGVFDDAHAALDRLFGKHAEPGARTSDLEGEAGFDAALLLGSLLHRAYQTAPADSCKGRSEE